MREKLRRDARQIALGAIAAVLPDEAVREQLCLFGEKERAAREKFEKAEKAMQILRNKYGRNCMAMGCAASEELGIYQPGFRNG